MKIFLAGISNAKFLEETLNQVPYILESFYYIKEWQLPLIKNAKMFLLDSGAFTFMNSEKDKKIDWDAYIERYAKFINDNNIEYFFELDIDVVVGIDEVIRLRNKLEKLTNKKCIPVWHKSRGIDSWKEICKNYDYVAIGGIVVGEITKEEYKYFTPLLKIAKKYNTKVHALGFTSTKELNRYNFYSVDSTSWSSGGRFGQVNKFTGKYIKAQQYKDKRVKDYKALDNYNLKEWLKMVNYADKTF